VCRHPHGPRREGCQVPGDGRLHSLLVRPRDSSQHHPRLLQTRRPHHCVSFIYILLGAFREAFCSLVRGSLLLRVHAPKETVFKRPRDPWWRKDKERATNCRLSRPLFCYGGLVADPCSTNCMPKARPLMMSICAMTRRANVLQVRQFARRM
jgi:hypothetical protein